MDDILKLVRDDLKRNSDEHTGTSGHKFFKEPVKLHGVKTATVSRIAKEHFQAIRERSRQEIFALCEDLWQSGYMEESFVACAWAYNLRKRFAPEDFRILERWVQEYVSNWASCDTLCNHTIAAFIDAHPRYLRELKRWAKSPNRWMRRAAAVTLIVPAREGRFLTEVLEIADILLLDQDDLVQKGYGWMLKAASQAHQREVFAYVMENKVRMPRTALRYAIEKMPQELRKKAMEK